MGPLLIFLETEFPQFNFVGVDGHGFFISCLWYLNAAVLKICWSSHELLEREIIFYHAHLFLFEGRSLIVVLEGWQSDSFPAGMSLVP